LERRGALDLGLAARHGSDEACTRGERSARARAQAPRVQTRATWRTRYADFLGASETKRRAQSVAHFSRFAPLTTAYNFTIGIRVLQLLDFELQASKLWFVNTTQNSGNQPSKCVKLIQKFANFL
jgi:hypothetical protein